MVFTVTPRAATGSSLLPAFVLVPPKPRSPWLVSPENGQRHGAWANLADAMDVLTGPWPARASWALLPLLVGPALGTALDDHSRAVALTGAGMAWATWAGVLVAVLVPRTVSLTALRIAAPAAFGAAGWAAWAGERAAVDVLAMTGAALALVAAFSPLTGEGFVNGSAYGDERRLLLRVPGAVLFGPVVIAGIAAVTPWVAGPLLLAARQWAAGALVLGVGGPIAGAAIRALHGLSRRWAVLVPAGMVLHDLHTMTDPVLFPRRLIGRLGPAPAAVADGTIDLTDRSLGLALELTLTEPLEVSPRRPDKAVQVVPVRRLIFTPTRPGALLAEAARRRLPVG